MKVSKCKKCFFCERRTWSSSYKPANYHEIGVSHAYRYCTIFEKRCLEIKEKECLSFLNSIPDVKEAIKKVDILKGGEQK